MFGKKRLLRQLRLEMDREDFLRMISAQSPWKGAAAASRSGRFTVVKQGPEINYDFAMAYWFDDYTTLLICETYVLEVGKFCQILADEDTGNWVLTTDFIAEQAP